MPKRWGLGPVFFYESLVSSRRWQGYAGRSLFVLMLFAGMLIVWVRKDYQTPPAGPRSTLIRQMAQVGEGFFYALVGIQVSLVLLAAPAVAAGSICVDRSNGTLLHLMVTDLSDAEVVFGKLAARLSPMFRMIACAVPVMAISGLLGGIDFGALLGAFAVSLSLAVFGCALAFTISVWAKKMHEALMAVYTVVVIWLLVVPIWESPGFKAAFGAVPDWVYKGNPFVLVFAPYTSPGWSAPMDFVIFMAAVLSISAALTGLVVLKLRPVVVASAGRAERGTPAPRRRRFRILPDWAGPSLDFDPVLWREWHRNQPSRLGAFLWVVLLLVTWGLVVWGAYDQITDTSRRPISDGFRMGLMLHLVFGLLMVSVTSATVLAEERVRGSLDVLMSTPVPTWSIVLAKWCGVYRWVLVLAPLPIFVTAFDAVMEPSTPNWPPGVILANPVDPVTGFDRILAVYLGSAELLVSGAVLVSTGVLLATWIRRLGRAVAASVTFYFVTGIAWMILGMTLIDGVLRHQSPDWFSRHQRLLMNGVFSLTPTFGTIGPLDVLSTYQDRTNMWLLSVAIVQFKAFVAIMFLAITLLSFNRCLGRVPERRLLARSRGPVVLEELPQTVS